MPQRMQALLLSVMQRQQLCCWSVLGVMLLAQVPHQVLPNLMHLGSCLVSLLRSQQYGVHPLPPAVQGTRTRALQIWRPEPMTQPWWYSLGAPHLSEG
jgi:hypothetical protein